VVVELGGAMTSAEVVRVCERVEALLRAQTPVRADVRGADLAVLDAIARMRLCARRLGALLEVTACEGFGDLVGLAGLRDALQVEPQAEPREQAGVEEVVDVGDPSA
jgi:hypothetical protein